MEEEEIGLVLGRACELKNKLKGCIFHDEEEEEEDSLNLDNNDVLVAVETTNNTNSRRRRRRRTRGEEEEEERLVEIGDAFEALEQQLSTLQVLQQQQRYERESSLFQIDRSRKMLLSKLKEYEGSGNLEVIQEALAFAGGTLDHDADLLLPPYPSHLPDLFVMDGHCPSSRFTSNYKLNENGGRGEVVQGDGKSVINGSSEELQRRQPTSRNKPQGIMRVFGLVAKSALTFVGVVAILSMAGFKPMLRKDGTQLKIQEIFQRAAVVECPPGKVLVIEEGQPRCLVKERVEIPFDLDVTAPKINYGFG